MLLACTPHHPLADRPRIRIGDLNEVEYIGFTRDLVIRRQVDRFLRQKGASPRVVLEFDNIESIKRAVEEGAGVALLPEPTFRREIAAGTLISRPLEGSRLLRPIGIIYRKHLELSSFALGFMSLLREASPAAFTEFGPRRSPATAKSRRPSATPSRKKS